MVFTIVSAFEARRVTECLVLNGFDFNFSILSKKCDTVFELEKFLH